MVQKLVSYFFADYRCQQQALWFRKTLYLYLLAKCIYWLIYFPVFFGAGSVIYFIPVSVSSFKDLAFLLNNNQSPALNAVCICLAMIICLYRFFYQKAGMIADLFAWFIVLNLHNVVYPALSGGDYLLNQFLLFNCFLSTGFSMQNAFSGNLKLLLHNLSALAIMIQVCMAYFLSALGKLASSGWTDGNAIAVISQVRHFSLYSFPTAGMGWLALVLNYLILFYQALFPVLVWVRPLTKTVLLMGVCMHLYIAFVMGLPWFAFIMMAGYLFFWPFRQPEMRNDKVL